MTDTTRWLIMGFLLFAALICYTLGFSTEVMALLFAGAAFELLFWLGLFTHNKQE
ncbi:hypothetical protein [Litorilituus lipolyticus]|uniref:hypothetical protein n=1 Tax=Litorilituus lipolyticus TaxID=2491017 RepID=UPI00147824EB|nr:hypothetical protein [Litorilituus lipolyticus]